MFWKSQGSSPPPKADVLEITRIYPVINRVWTTLDSMFVTDSSEWHHEGPFKWTDPWGRKFPNTARDVQFDKEGDVCYWDYYTTVDGEKVHCRIFND